MDVKQYGKVLDAVEQGRAFIDDAQEEEILKTAEVSFNAVEQYCKKNAPYAEVHNKARFNKKTGDIEHEILIYIGDEKADAEFQKTHGRAIADAIANACNGIGWGEEDDEN